MDTSPTSVHASAAVGFSAHGKPCMITVANDGTDDVGASSAHQYTSSHQPSKAQLPNSQVYQLLIKRFQRPMKAPDSSAMMLTVRPMGPDNREVDKIESKLDQQLASLDVLDTCVAECRAAVKPRLKETVQVCFEHLL